jgi:hypothetical protein
VEELEPTVEPAPNREVAREKIARSAIADRDAEAVAEVILRVARHVYAVAAALGPRFGCFTHGGDDRAPVTTGPTFGRQGFIVVGSTGTLI